MTNLAMRHRLFRGSVTLEGDPVAQARELWRHWQIFRILCYNKCLLPAESVELVVEDYVLRAGEHAGGKDGTAPERVAYAFEGYRHGRYDTYRRERHIAPIIWQMPSDAFRYKKRSILEDCGAWVVGREHERSAYSHMILRIHRLLNRNVGARRN